MRNSPRRYQLSACHFQNRCIECWEAYKYLSDIEPCEYNLKLPFGWFIKISWGMRMYIQGATSSRARSTLQQLRSMQVCHAVLCNILFMHGVENLSWSNVQTNIRELVVNIHEVFVNIRKVFANVRELVTKLTKVFFAKYRILWWLSIHNNAFHKMCLHLWKCA